MNCVKEPGIPSLSSKAISPKSSSRGDGVRLAGRKTPVTSLLRCEHAWSPADTDRRQELDNSTVLRLWVDGMESAGVLLGSSSRTSRGLSPNTPGFRPVTMPPPCAFNPYPAKESALHARSDSVKKLSEKDV